MTITGGSGERDYRAEYTISVLVVRTSPVVMSGATTVPLYRN